jgi:hypothetical protein
MIISTRGLSGVNRDIPSEAPSRFETKTLPLARKAKDQAPGPIQRVRRDGSRETELASLRPEPRNLPIFYDSLQAAAGHLFEGGGGNIIRERFDRLAIWGQSGEITAITDVRFPMQGFLWQRGQQPPFWFRNSAESGPITGETGPEIAAIRLVQRAAIYFSTPRGVPDPH